MPAISACLADREAWKEKPQKNNWSRAFLGLRSLPFTCCAPREMEGGVVLGCAVWGQEWDSMTSVGPFHSGSVSSAGPAAHRCLGRAELLSHPRLRISHCYSFPAALLSFLPSILMSVIFCVRENSTVTMISFWSTLDRSECGGLQHILNLLNHRNLNKLSFKIFFPFASSSPLSISVIMRYEFRHPTSYLYKHEHSAGAWWALTDSPSLICASNNTLWL